jgi:hypothetical protein
VCVEVSPSTACCCQKAPRATIYGKKDSAGRKTNKNFMKNYYCVSFLDERRQHKCTWGATCSPRAACLRLLV